jgi:hypothetical protein
MYDPGKDIGILAGEQGAVMPLLPGIEAGIDVLGEGHQQQVELEHAAATQPVNAALLRGLIHVDTPDTGAVA